MFYTSRDTDSIVKICIIITHLLTTQSRNYSKCLKSERSDFGAFQSCPIPKQFDFRRSVDQLDQPNDRVSDVYSITERSNKPNSPNV